MLQMYLGRSKTDKAQTCETLTDLRLQTRHRFVLLWLCPNQQGQESGLGDRRCSISPGFKLIFDILMSQVRSSAWGSIW